MIVDYCYYHCPCSLSTTCWKVKKKQMIVDYFSYPPCCSLSTLCSNIKIKYAITCNTVLIQYCIWRTVSLAELWKSKVTFEGVRAYTNFCVVCSKLLYPQAEPKAPHHSGSIYLPSWAVLFCMMSIFCLCIASDGVSLMPQAATMQVVASLCHHNL